MKIYYPYLFKATFSRPRFQTPILYNCLYKYTSNVDAVIHRQKRDKDIAFVFINTWKNNSKTLELFEKFDKYHDVKVIHNDIGDYWIFSPIFQTEIPQIQVYNPLKVINYEYIYI